MRTLIEHFENKGNVIDTLLNSYDTTDKKFNNMVDSINLNDVNFGKNIKTKKNISASGDINSSKNIIASGDVKSGGVNVGANGTIYAKRLNLTEGIEKMRKDGWKSGAHDWKTVENGKWGGWNGGVDCPDGSYVCGLRTRFEGSQGGGDDTALNGIKMKCCKF